MTGPPGAFRLYLSIYKFFFHDEGVLAVAVVTGARIPPRITRLQIQRHGGRVGNAHLQKHFFAARRAHLAFQQGEHLLRQPSAAKAFRHGNVGKVCLVARQNGEGIARQNAAFLRGDRERALPEKRVGEHRKAPRIGKTLFFKLGYLKNVLVIPLAVIHFSALSRSSSA